MKVLDTAVKKELVRLKVGVCLLLVLCLVNMLALRQAHVILNELSVNFEHSQEKIIKLKSEINGLKDARRL